jgi:catechol 2,3-dioxygenase-like lactoylglutathione lyase family enzyme
MAVPRPRLEEARGVEGIDHVTLTVADARAARRFYEVALQPLGFAVVLDWPDGGRTHLGLPSETSSLWLVQGNDARRGAVTLAAPDSGAVDAFYAAALAGGGREVSPPATRFEHTASTYAAEVLDPDGNVLEAICWHAVPVAAEHAA